MVFTTMKTFALQTLDNLFHAFYYRNVKQPAPVSVKEESDDDEENSSLRKFVGS